MCYRRKIASFTFVYRHCSVLQKLTVLFLLVGVPRWLTISPFQLHEPQLLSPLSIFYFSYNHSSYFSKADLGFSASFSFVLMVRGDWRDWLMTNVNFLWFAASSHSMCSRDHKWNQFWRFHPWYSKGVRTCCKALKVTLSATVPLWSWNYNNSWTDIMSWTPLRCFPAWKREVRLSTWLARGAYWQEWPPAPSWCRKCLLVSKVRIVNSWLCNKLKLCPQDTPSKNMALTAFSDFFT